MLTVRFSADQDLSSQYDLLDRYFKKPIERIDGVARVELAGVEAREVRILVDPGRLAAHAVDIRQLVQLLEKSNFSVGAGQITGNGERLSGASARRVPFARRDPQPGHQGQRASSAMSPASSWSALRSRAAATSTAGPRWVSTCSSQRRPTSSKWSISVLAVIETEQGAAADAGHPRVRHRQPGRKRFARR